MRMPKPKPDKDPGRSDAATPSKAETMMHPVRLRILNALEGRRLTPREIGAVLPEVAQATLYRHIARLQEAGLIAVAEERATGGTIERTYTVVREETLLSSSEVAQVGQEQMGGYFRAFVGMLLAAFDRYIRRADSANIAKDGVTFLAEAVYLNDEEYQRLRTQFLTLFNEAQQNKPGQGRRRRTVAAIVIPDPREESKDE